MKMIKKKKYPGMQNFQFRSKLLEEPKNMANVSSNN